jgi:putative (di)nucleoside polyphosphate hydrolase
MSLPTVGHREHPSGLPYRDCVGVVLVNAAGLVFTGQRLDQMVEAWQMPQGGIDEGEDPQDCARRELWEETGIDPALTSLIGHTPDWHYYDLPDELIGRIWKGRYCGQRQLWFALRFHGQDSDVNIATEHPEFRNWRWSPVNELVAMAAPFKRQLYADVLSVLGPLL